MQNFFILNHDMCNIVYYMYLCQATATYVASAIGQKKHKICSLKEIYAI